MGQPGCRSATAPRPLRSAARPSPCRHGSAGAGPPTSGGPAFPRLRRRALPLRVRARTRPATARRTAACRRRRTGRSGRRCRAVRRVPGRFAARRAAWMRTWRAVRRAERPAPPRGGTLRPVAAGGSGRRCRAVRRPRRPRAVASLFGMRAAGPSARPLPRIRAAAAARVRCAPVRAAVSAQPPGPLRAAARPPSGGGSASPPPCAPPLWAARGRPCRRCAPVGGLAAPGRDPPGRRFGARAWWLSPPAYSVPRRLAAVLLRAPGFGGPPFGRPRKRLRPGR